MAGEAEWESEEGIVSNSHKVLPNVVKGYMARLEDAKRGHISRALDCAGSCSPPGPEQLHYLRMPTSGGPREQCLAIIVWPTGANVFTFQQ